MIVLEASREKGISFIYLFNKSNIYIKQKVKKVWMGEGDTIGERRAKKALQVTFVERMSSEGRRSRMRVDMKGSSNSATQRHSTSNISVGEESGWKVSGK